MITIHAQASSRRFREFPVYADRKLHELVDDGITDGSRFMTSVVPRGTGRLASAVSPSGPFTIAPGHHIGAVGVSELIAPHAGLVDSGTGVDGPKHTAVKINRPARRWTGGTSRGTRARNGAMMFLKNGEEPRFRRAVKFKSSNKILMGKNFQRKTYVYMREWTRARVGVLTIQLGRHFSRGDGRPN